MEAQVSGPFSLTVLASGSAGNVAAVTCADGWLLIDIGLHANDLRRRLAFSGLDPADCKGCLLTHTHGDHWRDSSLAWLALRGIPLWLNQGHLETLRGQSRAVHTLQAANKLRSFECGTDFSPAGGVAVTPTEISHDSPPTFGFRFFLKDPEDSRVPEARLGFFSDLGVWNQLHDHLIEDLHLLALEFNYHPPLLEASPRPDFLKRRIAGPRGHLSNSQAGDVVSAIRSTMQNQTLVLLHLSKECNKQSHALAEARMAAASVGTIKKIEVALQDEPIPPLPILPTRHEETAHPDEDCGPLFQTLRNKAR
jgi:phosphoribosyl 1,2-cyclic phosphodiesterase